MVVGQSGPIGVVVAPECVVVIRKFEPKHVLTLNLLMVARCALYQTAL